MENILAIGNAICDIIFQVEENVLEQFSLPKGGMVLFDKRQCSALLEYLKNHNNIFTITSGGSAANTLNFLSQYGLNSRFICNIADGYYGTKYLTEMQNKQIKLYNTHVKDQGETAKSIILVTPDGERTMCTYLGCASEINIDLAKENYITSETFFYIEGYLWDRLITKKAISSLINLVHSKGGKVALSLSDSFCVTRHLVEFSALVQEKIDILFANEAEILALYKLNSLSSENLHILQAKVRESNLNLMIITRGKQGSIIISKQEIATIDTIAKEAVDSTGAGDAFAAGFIYGYISGFSNINAAHIGNNLAGQVVSYIGARPEITLPKNIDEIEYINEIKAAKIS